GGGRGGGGGGGGGGGAVRVERADVWFPGHELGVLADWSAEAAGEAALQQWGWTLARDPEGVRHWRPRARGVGIDSERGYRFRGRTAALSQIAGWLDRPEPDRRGRGVNRPPPRAGTGRLGPGVTPPAPAPPTPS